MRDRLKEFEIKVEKKTSDFLDFFILFLMIENKKHTKISLFSLIVMTSFAS
jgi:hypothetical protein